MDINRFQNLISKNEHTKLDFKEKLSLKTSSEKKELAKDISAIANSVGGRGYMIFGVKDKTKEIVGVERERNIEEKIQQIIANRLDPPIPIKMEYIDYEEKSVGVLTVFKSFQKPHQLRQNGTFYIRRGSTTDIARRLEVASMFQETGIISAEMMPLYNSTIEDLEEKLIIDYCKKINLENKIRRELLEELGVLIKGEDGVYHLTIGANLVFGKYPQKYMPSSSVRIIDNLNSQKISRIFNGNVLYMLDECELYIKRCFWGCEYPLEAIFESLRNAIVHRDYLDYNRETVVYLGKNKVEITNPGLLIKGDKITSIIREKSPARRNNWIYQKLLIMDDRRRYLESGMGLIRIQEFFENKNRVKFINVSKRNIFKVILPGARYYF